MGTESIAPFETTREFRREEGHPPRRSPDLQEQTAWVAGVLLVMDTLGMVLSFLLRSAPALVCSQLMALILGLAICVRFHRIRAGGPWLRFDLQAVRERWQESRSRRQRPRRSSRQTSPLARKVPPTWESFLGRTEEPGSEVEWIKSRPKASHHQ